MPLEDADPMPDDDFGASDGADGFGWLPGGSDDAALRGVASQLDEAVSAIRLVAKDASEQAQVVAGEVASRIEDLRREFAAGQFWPF